MNLNLEDERKELRRMEYWFQAEANALPSQRKLVQALEQLEQARGALKQVSVAANNEDATLRTIPMIARIADGALKQQEVGDG